MISHKFHIIYRYGAADGLSIFCALNRIGRLATK